MQVVRRVVMLVVVVALARFGMPIVVVDLESAVSAESSQDHAGCTE